MSEKKKPTGVGEDTAHRPMIIDDRTLEENWKRIFGNPKRRKKNAPTKTRMEKTNRKSSIVSNAKVG